MTYPVLLAQLCFACVSLTRRGSLLCGSIARTGHPREKDRDSQGTQSWAAIRPATANPRQAEDAPLRVDSGLSTREQDSAGGVHNPRAATAIAVVWRSLAHKRTSQPQLPQEQQQSLCGDEDPRWWAAGGPLAGRGCVVSSWSVVVVHLWWRSGRRWCHSVGWLAACCCLVKSKFPLLARRRRVLLFFVLSSSSLLASCSWRRWWWRQ